MTDSKQYRAALVVIGNEVLSGRTQDLNTSYIGKKLAARGIVLVEVRVVPDIEDKIVKAVNELRGENDYVFTTGGIGPTHDDITSASIAAAFGVSVKVNDEALAIMTDHYQGQALTPPQKKMAMIPDGASLITNPVSGAPGFVIENVYVMAGVPRIMQGMLESYLDTLESGAPVLSKTVRCNLRESIVAEKLGALQKQYADMDIGSYPFYEDGVFGTNLVLRGVDESQIDEAVGKLEEIIKTLI